MEQEEILQEPVYSQQVLEFLAVAHKYCQFMEQVYRQSAENISDFLVQILPLLYFRGSLLPVINHIDASLSLRSFIFVQMSHWSKSTCSESIGSTP
jgi:hypothetical protein